MHVLRSDAMPERDAKRWINEARATLEETEAMLDEVILVHLSGKGQFSDDFFERLWRHLVRTARTLAVMQDISVQEAFEQAFSWSPSDEEWREELLPGLQEAAERYREENEGE